jgi:hypothetical protein
MPLNSEVAAIRQGLIQVNIGGKIYNAHHSSRCDTCMHPARTQIEMEAIRGSSLRDLEDRYSQTEYIEAGATKIFPKVGWMSIHSHLKNHTPVELAALRKIVEDRSRELSEQYDEQTAQIVDGYSFARSVLYQTHQRLVSGELAPSIGDGLAAARLIKEIDAESEGGVDGEVWSQAMMVYFETAQSIMPAEMWTRFTEALAVNPVLHSIQRRLEAAADAPIEAEVVSDEGEEQL